MVVFLSFLALFLSLVGLVLGWLEVNKLQTQIKDLNEQVGRLKYNNRKRYYNKPKPQDKQLIKG